LTQVYFLPAISSSLRHRPSITALKRKSQRSLQPYLFGANFFFA
jgi:hypothetical protein